ncbi:hypothetical protein ILYODFUR_015376 [Ilyodon furcidens]|uniref:Uncharacterized protein n=1 Tax=Ilyodon furcidens TaxID=33524 RepID=A0ABV0V384_9TELE
MQVLCKYPFKDTVILLNLTLHNAEAVFASIKILSIQQNKHFLMYFLINSSNSNLIPWWRLQPVHMALNFYPHIVKKGNKILMCNGHVTTKRRYLVLMQRDTNFI